MARIIFNLTIHFVDDKIKFFLHNHDNYLYRKAFSLPDLHQELITYVLSRIHILYIAVEEEQETSMKHNKLYQLIEKRVRIETLIYQGMHDILPQNGKANKQHVFEEIEPGISQSSRFC